MSGYVGLKSLIELQCHKCHRKVQFDPQDGGAFERVKPWIKVQPSAVQDVYAFCGVDCLREGASFFRSIENGPQQVVLAEG